ncbi:MAG: type II toxin-antitoxin system HicA family toxin [Candidatus Aenigmarchaeota archaeon]|nr:type II toxin-antitoxin system HicA family toxin [Candidatus Aenigmarchaeota archaeon]
MTRLPILSGREIIKILSKNGFEIVGRKGSHVRMKKIAPNGIFIVVIPDHKEIPVGTLKSIIRQSDLSEEVFRER